jgi:hypothetical protein
MPDEIGNLGFEVTLNDISAHELALAPSNYRKVVCDIAADDTATILGGGAMISPIAAW